MDAGTLELVELDMNLDITPECEAPGVSCGLAVQWLATLKCCGERVMVCQPHYELNVEVIPGELCIFCNGHGDTDWRACPDHANESKVK